MSIKVRMILSVVAVFVIGAAGIAFAMQRSYANSLTSAAQASVERASVMFQELEKADTAKLASTLTGLMENEEYRDLFVAGDREALQSAAAPLFDRLKDEYLITHWYFETADDPGKVFLRVHKPEQFDDELKRKTYLSSVESKSYGSGLELGKTAVALRVVHPFYAADGSTILGYMELGQEIDQFLEQIREQTGDDVALLLLKEPMDAAAWAEYRAGKGLRDNWNDNEAFVVASSSSDRVAADAISADADIAALPQAGQTFDNVEEDGLAIARGMFPVRDAAGETIGAVYVRHDITQTAAALRAERLTVLAFVLGMMFLVTVIIMFLMDRLVFKRLNGMIEGMQEISTRLAGGDFDVHYAGTGSADEIGRFEEFFARFIDMVGGTFKQFTKKP